MNIIPKDSPDLGDVVLPLARVLADEDLTWHERVELSCAVQACYRHWSEMGKAQKVVDAQSAAGYVGCAIGGGIANSQIGRQNPQQQTYGGATPKPYP